MRKFEIKYLSDLFEARRNPLASQKNCIELITSLLYCDACCRKYVHTKLDKCKSLGPLEHIGVWISCGASVIRNCDSVASKFPWDAEEIVITDSVTPATYRFIIKRPINATGLNFEGILHSRCKK